MSACSTTRGCITRGEGTAASAGYAPRSPPTRSAWRSGYDGRSGSGRALGSVASVRGSRRSADREGSLRRARRGERVRRALPRPRGVARRRRARARGRRARGAPGAGRARGRRSRASLFAADTQTPRHGALLQHVQERGTEIRNALLFFELEWLAVDAERAEALLGDAGARAAPALPRRAAPLPRARALGARGARARRDPQHRQPPRGAACSTRSWPISRSR